LRSSVTAAALQKLVDPTGLKPAPYGLKGRRSVTRAPGQHIADFQLPIADRRLFHDALYVQRLNWQSAIGNWQ
jgi:hypothetical protein